MLFCMRMNAYIMHGKNDVKNKKMTVHFYEKVTVFFIVRIITIIRYKC